MRVIISILGLGRWDREKGGYVYEKARYAWDDRKTVETDFFPEALAEWFPDATFLLLGTQRALEARDPHLSRLGNSKRVLKVTIPEGRGPEEYWEIYNSIAEALPEGAEVVLDITHGYRSLGMIAFLAIAFLQAARRVRLSHVLYAAFEARTPEGITPVFDLAPFVSILDWANATQHFLETGDAGKFQPLAEARGAKPVNLHLNRAVKGLGSLSSALAANRALEIGEVARKTLDSLEKAQQEEWASQHQPLKLLLPRLKAMLSQLALEESPSQEDHLRQNFALVLWLLQNQQFEKALGLAREWMVSFAQYRRQGSWYPISPASRKEAEEWVKSCAKGESKTPPGWEDFIQLWRDLGDLRNDLMHFGFRESPRRKESIPQEVKEKIHRLRDVVRGMGFELPEGKDV